MYIRKTFTSEKFDSKVTFIISSNIMEAHKKIYKKHNIKESIIEDETRATKGYEGAVLIPTSSYYYILIDSKYLSYDTITHEIYHCARRMCTIHSNYSEEEQATTAGWLGSKIFNLLKEKNIQIGG